MTPTRHPRLPLRHVLGAALLALACAAALPAHAQAPGADDEATRAAAAHRKAGHERIQREREVIAARRHQDEAACYQRFAVEDCLRAVRAQARDAESRLRSQEIELNDAERKDKAAQRLRGIEEKQRGTPPPATAASGDAAPQGTVRGAPAASRAQREQDAGERARQQRERVQKQAREQAEHSQASARRAADARERHAETLRAAEERRARVDRARAEAAARGRQPAAPLPPTQQ